MKLNEDSVEHEALEILRGIGYETLFGPEITPDGLYPMRELYSDVVWRSND